MDDYFKIKKLTDCKWTNLFEVFYKRKNFKEHTWMMCSRKAEPITTDSAADAVIIVATINTPAGKRLVVTKEFRVPLWDYEYGFAAGLIDKGEEIEQTIARELKEETGLDLVKINHISKAVYSSAGLTDESCHMAIVEAAGEPSNQWVVDNEDIEVLLLDVEGVRQLLDSDKKIAAKAWGLLYCWARSGKID